MAHLRPYGQTCDESGCSTRASEALYGIRNALYGYYCKRHAHRALDRLVVEEQRQLAAGLEPPVH